jgi:nucleotidyltransferase substrate binding protein (TIGR01987 family)
MSPTADELNYDKLKHAINRLDERYGYYLSHKTILDSDRSLLESVRESCIQRFEVCFDTSWKHLKKHLESQGLSNIPNSPNGIFKVAFAAQVIEDVESWILFGKARIATSHDYDGLKADQTFEVIASFLPVVKSLYQFIIDNP